VKPHRIFLVRHGEAEGNLDKNIFKVKPDYATLLTPLGIRQAQAVGSDLGMKLNGQSLAIYWSPYFRTRQTADEIIRKLEFYQTAKDFMREEPLLREQEWTGSFRKTSHGSAILKAMEAQRDKYGHFLYRLGDESSTGESCADVYDRTGDFNHTLWRDFQKKNFPKNVLLVTHGMTMRVFAMRWFHLRMEEFEILANPKNCELWEMELDPCNDKYQLITEPRKYDEPRSAFPYPFPPVGSRR
jgi:broad specificity phosphatase PhoE